MLSPIHDWLLSHTVSEILLNQPGEIWVEEKGKMTCFQVPELNERYLAQLFLLVANENRQSIGHSKPLLSGNLGAIGRIQLVHPPAAKYFCFAIRKQCVQQRSLEDYQASGFFEHASLYQSSKECDLARFSQQNDWYELVKVAIQRRKNIVVSGGTATGKTTFLNACLTHIPKSQRIITIEDAEEIHLQQPNHVQLLVSKGNQGESNLTAQDMVQCCLRLRPDRIVMGEIRGAEVLDFISACSTGHEGSMTSIHANNPDMALMRMVQMYKLNPVPSMRDEEIMNLLTSVVDVIIQLGRSEQNTYQCQSIKLIKRS